MSRKQQDVLHEHTRQSFDCGFRFTRLLDPVV